MNLVNHINSIILEGNMTREAEYRQPKTGFKVARFPIAVNRVYKKRSSNQLVEEVSYFDVEAHDALADECWNNGGKGRGIRCVGHIRQDRWEDKDGKKHSKVLIIAEYIEFKSKLDRPTMEDAIKSHEAIRNTTMAANPATASAM